MNAPGSVSVIVVTYNHRPYIAACVASLERVRPPRGGFRLILVDNASTDGTADLVRDEVLNADGRTTRGGLSVVFFANKENLGFSGGNNLAIKRALADGDEWVYLLNPDTEVDPDFLLRAVDAAGSDPGIAMVQSLLLRHPDTGKVNTWGNAQHFLGFGYAAGDGEPVEGPAAARHLSSVHDIAYPSGAGCLIRSKTLRVIGLFEEELFAYHEDLELGLRARAAGHRVVLAPHSRVMHKYEFSRGGQKFYLLERNRLLVLLWYYSVKAWILIAPAFVLMELGLLAFAAQQGWLKDKARAYRYFFSRDVWTRVSAARDRIKKIRTVAERDLLAPFVAEIDFQSVRPWLLTHVGNPVLRVYWKAVRALLWL